MRSSSDRQLLTAAAAGDEAAFASLYARYAGRLSTYFQRHLPEAVGETASDYVQSVFVQLLDSKAFSNPEGSPDSLAPLLFTIARNLRNNAYRYREREDRRRAIFAERWSDETSSLPAPDVDAHRLEAAIEALPLPQREAVRLRFLAGWSIAEIAERTAVAPGTIKSRLHYGLRKLSKMLPLLNISL